MKYKKETCPNCNKEFRKVIDSNWVVFCSDACADEHETNRRTSSKNDKDIRQSA